MPQPTIAGVHVDSILTNISVAYAQQESRFIAGQVFPQVPVEKKSDKYFTYTKNDWFRDEAQRRAPGTESAGGGYNLSTDTYTCDVWAYHKDVDAQTLANSDAPLNPMSEASRFVTTKMLVRREVQFVADYLKTGVWAKDLTGVSGTPSTDEFKQWSDYANSDPLEDMEGAKEQILTTTGYEGNTLVLGYQVFRRLKNHPDIVDRIKYTSSENVSAELIARMFEVDRVLVAKAVKATNNEGATGAYSLAVGKIAGLFHVASSPALLTPSAGYQFGWTGVSGSLGQSVAISQFPMAHLKSTRVEGEAAWDNKVVATDLGVFMTSVVA